MITLTDLTVAFDDRFTLTGINWEIDAGQHWLITGANGAGKSALAAVLAGYGDILSGDLAGVPENVALVSYEVQGELIEAERRKDDADILDVVAVGTTVAQLLADAADQALAAQLIERFGLTPLLARAFRSLSTGETRKLLLVRAMSNQPALLVLDEPFDGLDAAAQAFLADQLIELSAVVPMALVLNRLDECPPFITHVARIDHSRLQQQVPMHDTAVIASLRQLQHLETSDLSVPPADPNTHLPPLDPARPLVELNNASVRYGDTVIFSGIDWTIEAGKHWQLTGPNGSGKTCLLSLITGDHPQCYVNDIEVFGFQRGSGESIWQIKQYIGYVSTALHWEYRVGSSLRHVIISGFYDTIGVYSRYSDTEKAISDQWLALLGMLDRADEPFNAQSHGDQRLLLIARAMVKHPPLLILDEPCLGLDELNRQLVLALISRICAGSDSTVLYVNHHSADRIPEIEHTLCLA